MNLKLAVKSGAIVPVLLMLPNGKRLSDAHPKLTRHADAGGGG